MILGRNRASSPRRLASNGVQAVLVIGFFVSTPTCLAGSAQPSPGSLPISSPEWQKGFTLVLSDVSTPAALHKTVEVIQSVGGKVAVITEPDIVFGWIPTIEHQVLLRAGVRAVYADVTPLAAFDHSSERTVAAARFFNAVKSGEFFTRRSPPRPASTDSGIAESRSPDMGGFKTRDFHRKQGFSTGSDVPVNAAGFILRFFRDCCSVLG